MPIAVFRDRTPATLFSTSSTRIRPTNQICTMSAPPVTEPTGPPQRGNGTQSQYVYALIFLQPAQEIMMQATVKQPEDFDRAPFREMVVKCLAELGITVVGNACFGHTCGASSLHPCSSAATIMELAGEKWCLVLAKPPVLGA